MLRLRILFCFLIFLAVFSLIAIMGSVMETPFYLTRSMKINVSYLMPQGWAFFTRDSREPRLFVYKFSDQMKLERINVPGSSAKYLFGLDRYGRKISSEYVPLISKIDSLRWMYADFDLDTIAKRSMRGAAIVVANDAIKPQCCGEIIIVKANIIPWAYSHFDNIKMPAKFIKLYVNCPNNKKKF